MSCQGIFKRQSFFGDKELGWQGVIGLIEKGKNFISNSMWRDEFSRYKHKVTCPICRGSRLKKRVPGSKN